MKPVLISTLLIISAIPSPTLAYRLNLAECRELSNSLNQDLPSVVNKDFVVTSTYCSGSNKEVKFTYTYELTYIPEGKPTKENKKKLIKMFCSNPKTRFLLDGVSFVEFDYYNLDGAFYANVNFSVEDCE